MKRKENPCIVRINLLNQRLGKWPKQSLLPLIRWFLYHFAFSVLQISFAFAHSAYISTEDFKQRAAGASFWLLSPRLLLLSLEINGCLFFPVLSLYMWTDTASTIVTHFAELFSFSCDSWQLVEISGGRLSSCLSHLVFGLLKKSGL